MINVSYLGAVSRIYCKFEAKFLCTVYKYILPIWNYLSNNFLRFVIFQNFRYTAEKQIINDFLYYLLKNNIRDLKKNTHVSVFYTITRYKFKRSLRFSSSKTHVRKNSCSDLNKFRADLNSNTSFFLFFIGIAALRA